MRFHLIDRIDEVAPGRHVRGRKLVSGSEQFWEDAGGEPVMPAPLVLEALCQAGTWLIMLSTDRRKRAALLQVGSVRFTGDVQRGDVVILDGVVESMDEDMAVLSGGATVDGKPIMQATDIMCALIPAADLQAPDEADHVLRMLTRS